MLPFLELKVFERAQSDVVFDVGEVPAEVQALGLSTAVIAETQADEACVWRHLCHLSFEVVIHVGCNEASVSENELTLGVFKRLEVGLCTLTDILPRLATRRSEVRMGKPHLLGVRKVVKVETLLLAKVHLS